MAAPSAPLPLLISAAAAALLGAASLLLWRRRRRLRWTPAGILAAIHVYPLKSGAGFQCHRARVTGFGVRSGAALDRSLALVCNGTILCAMSRRRMVLISTEMTESEVTLTAPGMPPLTVPLPKEGDDVTIVKGGQFGCHNEGIDLGVAAGRWLADYFGDGKTYTLMFFQPNWVQARRTVDIPKPYARFAKSSDVAAFQNVTALSVICSASLDELNARLDTPVSEDNFRHNLVVADAPAFDDDDWAFVKIGDAVMRRVKSVNRCGNTCVDPKTAERSAKMDPLRTLKTFRLAKDKEEREMYKESPLMGSAMGVDVEGEVAVGDTVYVLRK